MQSKFQIPGPVNKDNDYNLPILKAATSVVGNRTPEADHAEGGTKIGFVGCPITSESVISVVDFRLLLVNPFLRLLPLFAWVTVSMTPSVVSLNITKLGYPQEHTLFSNKEANCDAQYVQLFFTLTSKIVELYFIT